MKKTNLNKTKIKNKIIKFTAESNALDYLERAYEFIQKVESKPILWKWVMLSLHSALYGFSISACQTTDYTNLTQMTKRGRRLISFYKALELCQDSNWMGQLCCSKPLLLNERQKVSIDKMREYYRNNFEHYIPTFWIIPIHDFPQIAIDVLYVIQFLALETMMFGTLLLSKKDEEKINSLVHKSIKILKNSILYREYLIIMNEADKS